MAKSLKDILAGAKSSKTEKLDLKDLQMSAANKDQADFIAKHSVEKHADRVGNDDDVYKGKTKKTDKYKFQKDGVYESCCNHTNEGVMCEVHGESACPSDNDMGKKEKAKGKKLLLDKKKVMDEGRIEDDAQRRAAKELSAIAAKSNVPVTKLKPGKKSYNELKRTGSMFGGARQFAAGLAKRNIEAGDSHTSVTKAKVGGKIKEEIEDVEEVVRIVDPIRKKLDPKHGQKDGSFQSKMERMHMAKAAKDRRKLTHGSGVSGFNSRLDPKLDKETYKKRDQDTGSIRAVRKEEVEYIDEVLTGKDPASKWIHDFVHSDNPKFKGKSTKERQQMALGAYYKKKRGYTRNEQADTNIRMPGQASATTGGTDLDTVRV